MWHLLVRFDSLVQVRFLDISLVSGAREEECAALGVKIRWAKNKYVPLAYIFLPMP
jgi:hypothetical protein